MGEREGDGGAGWGRRSKSSVGWAGWGWGWGHARHASHVLQVRAKEVIEGRDCFQGHMCYEDLSPGMIMFDEGNTSDFGHGTAAGHFKLWTAEALGANPNGLMSACPISLRTFTSSGFIAIYQARTPGLLHQHRLVLKANVFGLLLQERVTNQARVSGLLLREYIFVKARVSGLLLDEHICEKGRV